MNTAELYSQSLVPMLVSVSIVATGTLSNLADTNSRFATSLWLKRKISIVPGQFDATEGDHGAVVGGWVRTVWFDECR